MRIGMRLPQARILVVDDEPAVADVIGALLRNAGATAAVVYDGRAAADALAASAFDLVLLDWMMPDLSGADTAALIRARDPAVRILVISGVGYDAIRAALRFGLVDGFLQKPFLGEELAAAVSRVLAGEHRVAA